MPKLEAYQSQQAAPTPSARGYQAPVPGAGALGRAIGEGMMQVAGALTERYNENEAARMAKEFATLQADLTVKQEEMFRTADPNDADVGRRFFEEALTPALDKLGETAETRHSQMLYDTARTNLEQSFKVNTAAKQANLAGVAAVQNYTTTTNMLSSGTRANPGNMENSMLLAEMGIPRNIDPAKRAELLRDSQRSIASASVMGLAERGAFDQAEQLVNSTKLDPYLDAPDKETLQTHIRTARNAAKADEAATEALRVKQVNAGNEQEANRIMSTVIQDDGSLVVPADFNAQIVGYSQRELANQGTTQALLNFGRSVTEDNLNGLKTVSDPATYERLRQRMFNGLTRAEVFMARADKLLSDKDFTFFKQAIEGGEADPQKAERLREFNRIMDGFKPSIGTMNMFGQFTRPENAQLFLFFSQDSQAIFDRMTAEGKSLNEITQAISAGLPNYQMGRAQSFERVRSNLRTNTPALPRPTTARQPGETIEAWRKRTGG